MHQGHVSDSKKTCHPNKQENHSYDLSGIVVHYGTGMNYGHYWALARTNN
jgi:hypothetical protein